MKLIERIVFSIPMFALLVMIVCYLYGLGTR